VLRHAPVRALLGLLLGFVAASATFLAADRLGETGNGSVLQTSAGPIDYDAYCDSRPGALRAVLVSPDALGWRCIGDVDGFFTSFEVDALDACRWQYGPVTEARMIDEDDPDGWQCVIDVAGDSAGVRRSHQFPAYTSA
jgi:hypothetical protein